MQSKGLDFLRPIWEMIYSDEYLISGEGLNLSESDVSVTYTRYVNNYKKARNNKKPNDKTIDDAMKDGFTPGKNF